MQDLAQSWDVDPGSTRRSDPEQTTFLYITTQLRASTPQYDPAPDF